MPVMIKTGICLSSAADLIESKAGPDNSDSLLSAAMITSGLKFFSEISNSLIPENNNE
jgi:hypothetical protein